MARLTGPDEGSRFVYRLNGNAMVPAVGAAAVFYTDATGTTLADIRDANGNAVASTLTVDTYSRLPLFQLPDGVDTVYVSVAHGPLTPVYARTDDRLDALVAGAAAEVSARAAADAAALVAANGTYPSRATGTTPAAAALPYTNVKDHGATGDGTTDDTAAFTAARASGAKRIQVPDGTYIVNGVTLSAAGQVWEIASGATVKVKTAGTQTAFTVTAANVSLTGWRGATINGNSVGVSGGSTVYVQAVAGATVRGLTFINCAGLGINGQGDQVHIEDNDLTDCGSSAIFITPPTTGADINDVRVVNNAIRNTATGPYGIQIHGNGAAKVKRLKVRGNDVVLPAATGSGLCIEVYGGCDKASVVGNTTFGGAMGVSVSGSTSVAVSGNTVESAKDIGIEIASSPYAAVSGNTVDGLSVTNRLIGVSNTGSNSVTFNGNTLRDWKTNGNGVYAVGATNKGLSVGGNAFDCALAGSPIYLQSMPTAAINGNTFDGHSAAVAGVELDTCTGVGIVGNVFHDFTTAGVNLYSGTMADIVIGPNVLSGATPAAYVNGPPGAGGGTVTPV